MVFFQWLFFGAYSYGERYRRGFEDSVRKNPFCTSFLIGLELGASAKICFLFSFWIFFSLKS